MGNKQARPAEQPALQPYFKYWGKARPAGESGAQYHLLPYHSLDVAAVGHALLKQNRAYFEHFLRLTRLDGQHFISWFTFLLALHDVGKFADSFQNLNPQVLQTLQERSSNRQYGLRHDSLGRVPRTRGDEPKLQPLKQMQKQRSPHTRG